MSPELQRNLWLELGPYRLASMPLILAAVLYLGYVTDNYRLDDKVASISVGLFFVISLLWGTKLAAEAIMNEIRDHTWDGQRMSVLTPWELTRGKLFGSTVYSWYGAAICLLAFGLANVQQQGPVQTVETMLALVLTGVLAHAVSLLASLLALQKERRFNRSQTAVVLLLGIFVAGPFFNLALAKSGTVTWFGFGITRLDFTFCSLAAYTLWGVVGVHQLMKKELQMTNSPLAWYGFVLFLMVHLAGLLPATGQGGGKFVVGGAPGALTAYFTAGAAVYFMALAERKDFLTLQALLRLASVGGWRFMERAPRWLLTIPLFMVAGGGLIVTAGAGETGATAGFVTASLFFLGRDLGIMIFCNLGTHARRADILTLICLALLYGVIPATLAVMNQPGATLIFWPRTDISPFLGSYLALFEMLLVAWMVWARWQKRVFILNRIPVSPTR